MFFCQVLQYSRTIVLLKKLKPLKKPLFQKRRWSCDFPPRKTPVAQKHRAISRQEKMAFSTPPPPRRVVLGLPSPSRRVCADGRTDGWPRDYYVTTKISRIDRLPNLLSNGAPGQAQRAKCSSLGNSRRHRGRSSGFSFANDGLRALGEEGFKPAG